ncbi:MAG: hypothetical protein U1E39_18835 [Planctomycetota bacterium]
MARGWTVAAAVLSVLAAGTARAQETVAGEGFSVLLPPAFTRCAPDVEQPMQSQLAAQGAALAGTELEVSRARVWAYEQTAEGLERVLLLWIPGSPPPVTDPAAYDSLREGLRAGLAGTGGEMLGAESERLRDGVEGVTLRMRFLAQGNARLRAMMIPRDGFMLFVYHFRSARSTANDDAAWRKVLDGVHVTAGPPPPAGSVSAAGRAGRIIGGVLVVGLLIVGVRAAAKRKPPPPRRAREGARTAGRPGVASRAASPGDRPPPLPRYRR